jgi:hypothetical protein
VPLLFVTLMCAGRARMRLIARRSSAEPIKYTSEWRPALIGCPLWMGAKSAFGGLKVIVTPTGQN